MNDENKTESDYFTNHLLEQPTVFKDTICVDTILFNIKNVSECELPNVTSSREKDLSLGEKSKLLVMYLMHKFSNKKDN